MAPYFDAKHDLKTYLKGLSVQCSPADLLDIMRRIRQLMESKGLRKNYVTVSLYCDWYMHVTLDRHPLGWDILAEINVIACYSSTGDPTGAIGARLRFDELRSQATALFNSQGLSPFLFTDDKNWSNFVLALLQVLCGKPIRWPTDLSQSKQARRMFDRMVQVPTLRPDVYPRALFLEHRPGGHEGAGFYWTVVLVETPHQVAFTGQLAKTAE